MKKSICLLLIAAVASGCSVDALDNSEILESADGKTKTVQDQEISSSVYEGPGNAEFIQNSGKLRGHVYVSNDCDNLYLEIVPTGDLPDDVQLGFFQGDSFPKENGTESDLVEYSDQASFTFPLSDFDTSQELRIFTKAWGAFAGTESWGNKASYFTFTFEEVECEEVCTYGKGHWKNHSNDNPGGQEDRWPGFDTLELKLGNVTYSRADWNEIFDASNNTGNGLIILAQHLMAAKLNVANGAGNPEIVKVIADADGLIGDLIVLEGSFTDEEKDLSKPLKNDLEAYNDSCDDDDSDEE